MAHEIDFSNSRANMAYVGQVPWHGLGQALKDGASIEEWQSSAGMNWSLDSYPALYFNPRKGEMMPVTDRRVLVRSDTGADLAVVSDSYHIVQPREVLEFYRDIVSMAGFKLETAGCLKGGRRYWALANIGQEAKILGQDSVDGYLLLATSCDGTLATTAMFTSVRVVCNNTLGFAVHEGATGKARQYLKIPHNRVFDPDEVKYELGLAKQSWDTFMEQARALAERKVSEKESVLWLIRVFGDADKPAEEQENGAARMMKRVFELYQGGAAGSDLKTANGTAWGLVNAVTEYMDHHRNTRTADSRLNKAWFGDGAAIKNEAWRAATDLLAA